MLSTLNVKKSFSGNGLTTDWVYDFQIYDIQNGSDIEVWLISPTGVESKLTSSYSIDTNTATVTYPTVASMLPALPSLWTIELRRVESLTQPIDITAKVSAVDVASAAQEAVDRLGMAIQQVSQKVTEIIVTGATPAQVVTLISELNALIGQAITAQAAAEDSEDAAAISAAAAVISAAAAAASALAAAAAVPPITGSDAYKVIQVKSDHSGYELTAGNAANRPIVGDSNGLVPLANIPSGTTANKVLALDSNAKIPAVDGSQLTGIVAIPSATVLPYAGATAPTGYLLCNGATISQTTYAALFAIIAHTYGADPGGGNFILPDLRGNVPVGYKASDTPFGTLGAVGGEKTHQLIAAEMPAHTHPQQSDTVIVGGGGFPPSGTSGSTFNRGGTTDSTGGDGSHNNLSPYIVLNYIIKY
jgi:microcystin-dependent protein